MTLTHNDRGEIPDHGPVYACARFGAPGHDYHTCKQCQERFKLRLQHLGRAS
jgi:hypothetical protein